MRRAAASVLAALCLAGCSKEPPPAPPPPAAAPRPAEPEAPPLPALGEVRWRDWSEVDAEPYLELPAPVRAPEFAWDFGPGRRYGYDFSETLSQRLERTMGEKRALNTSREKNRGTFEFVAGRDRTAAAIAKILTQEAVLNEQPVPRESFEKAPASVSECVVTESGSAETKQSKGRADARFYFQALLALQPGDRPLAGGTIHTRAAGFFKVERYECVRLESEFEVSSEQPNERQLLRGRVVGFFALAERKFVRASAAVGTSSRTNARTKEGVWVTSSLDAVTTYRIRLLD